LMECGILPQDIPNSTKNSISLDGKTSKDFDRQWEEVAASGAFTSEF
jgi:hypothetical protein